MQAKSLRSYLRELPGEFEYDHRRLGEMRTDLRNTLFFHATGGGKYLSKLFSGAGLDEQWERMTEHHPPGDWIESGPNNHNCAYSHPGRPCARKLSSGEPTHRCLTCGLDETCALCKYCFNPADHEGHNVFVKVSSLDGGGICDCGDPEAWTRPLSCMASRGNVSQKPLPEEFENLLRETLDIALDYALDVLAAAHPGLSYLTQPVQIREAARDSELDPERWEGPDLPGDGRFVLSMWHDDKRSYTDCYANVLLATERPRRFAVMIGQRLAEYGRATLTVSRNLDRLLAQKSRIRHFVCTIRTTRDHLREEMADEIIHWCLDLSQAIAADTAPMSLAHVVGESLLASWRVGTRTRNRITGLAQLMATTGPPGHYPASLHLLLGPQAAFPSLSSPSTDDYTGLFPGGPSPTSSTDAWNSSHTGQNGINNVSIHSDSDASGASSVAPDGPLTGSRLGPSTLTTDEAESSRLVDLMPENFNVWVPDEPSPDSKTDPSRVKYLMFFDIRLWKSLRATLNDLYVNTLIADASHKLQLGIIYADIHPRIVEFFVLLDREPETSVLAALSTQLFTTPSISTALMHTDIYTQYFAAVYTLFTRQTVAPASSITARPTKLSTTMFRNRRLPQLFHDLDYLLMRNTEKELVGGSVKRILQCADFLSLFQDLAPVARHTDKHVEFENENWVFYFTTMPQILGTAATVASCISYASYESAVSGVASVAMGLIRWSVGYLLKLRPDPETRMISVRYSYAGISVMGVLSGLSVANDLMSLHHPVNAFLTLLVGLTQFPDRNALVEALFPNFDEVAATAGLPLALVQTLLFDYNLRTMAFLSEVHVGLWVRNGYAIRQQLHHYRESTLRDPAYERDVAMAQLALICLEPNLVFSQLVYRWNMAQWPTDPLFDDQQAWYMLEEFLHTLTFLMCDRIRLQPWDDETRRMRSLECEIIQCLMFGDHSYSELLKLVPESMATDQRFDSALFTVANFTEPRGTRGVGQYSLKPEFAASFDPHYTYFNAARIEEAERELTARLAKLGQAPADGVYTPPLLELPPAYKSLCEFTRSIAFARWIFDTVSAILAHKDHPHAESSMAKIMYLLIIAATEDLRLLKAAQRDGEATAPVSSMHPNVFPTVASLIMAPESANGTSLNYLLRCALADPAFASAHLRIHKLYALLHERDSGVEVPSPPEAAESRIDERARRKQQGQAVQQKLFEEFRRRQKEFMDMHADDEEAAAVDDDAMSADCDASVEGFTYPANQCILCRLPDDAESVFGILTYLGPVRVLREHDRSWTTDGYSGLSSLDVEHTTQPCNSDNYGPAYSMDLTKITVSMNSCGHGVHHRCLERFQAEQQRNALAGFRASPENLARGEFLCPLCRGLNNAFVPVLWQRNTLTAEDYLASPSSPPGDMEKFLKSDKTMPQDLNAIVASGTHDLTSRFADALSQNLGEDPFAMEVKGAILALLLKIKSASEPSIRSDLLGIEYVLSVLHSTVGAIEVAHRGRTYASPFGGLVVDQLSPKQVQFLRSLSKYIMTLISVVVRSCMRLNQGEVRLGLFGPLDASQRLVDPLMMLIEGLFVAVPCYGVSPYTVMRAAYAAALAQVFAHLSTIDICKVEPASDVPQNILAILQRVSMDPERVWTVLQRHVSIFMRQASIIVFSICGAYDPDDYAGQMIRPEHQRLAEYLQLPSLVDFVASLPDSIEGTIVNELLNSTAHLPFAGVYRLINLPLRLDTFFNLPSGISVPSDPAVCLFCGDIVATQAVADRFGDTPQVGSCNRHVATCTECYGIFLLPRRNILLLLLPDSRGTFVPAPYLDIHGEPDESMRRMRPHFLQPARYEHLTRSLWLENGIMSATLCKLDETHDQGGWETL